jgi:hypothetical protein
MSANGKIISFESIPGMGERGIKENGGGDEFNYDIFNVW